MASAKAEKGMLCRKCWGYLRSVARLAACQWSRGQFRPHPGGEETSEYKQLQSWSNNTNARRTCQVRYQLPGMMMLLTRRGWHFTNGGEGNHGKEALARGLVYLFLTCSGSIDIVVTPPHNHQTSSMCTKPPNEVVWFWNWFDSHSTKNWFMCRSNESGHFCTSFTPLNAHQSTSLLLVQTDLYYRRHSNYASL